MSDYSPASYGERVAAFYDRWHHGQLDTDGAVALLAKLAGSGPVLELGVGTGRLALPLQAAGFEVHGIEASSAMLDRLRAKPGGRDLTVSLGDFAELSFTTSYSLVFAAFNTLLALPDHDSQLRCFQRVAAALRSSGHFVVEAIVPDLSRFESGHSSAVIQVDDRGVLLADARIEPAEQRLIEQHLLLTDDGVYVYPLQLRYTWPDQLDLMATAAGLTLDARWADWRQTPFTPESPQHVSVYRRP